jgi:peptide/nickel transport system permease protein
LRLKGALFWTVVLSLLSLVLTFLIAVPLGVFSARRSGSRADAVVSTVLFVLYSMPNFWIATLLILFFGEQLGWFPIFGVGEVAENATWWQTLEVRAKHLVLPLICWTYPSLAFLSRQMRGSMLEQLQQEFIKTARAKGLTEGKVMWRHAFRNSLLPIITILGDVLPSLVAGSIVIETIFSINGMGQLLLQAIAAKDFPILFAIVLLTALLTFIGHLSADLLYGWANPRVREQ